MERKGKEEHYRCYYFDLTVLRKCFVDKLFTRAKTLTDNSWYLELTASFGAKRLSGKHTCTFMDPEHSAYLSVDILTGVQRLQAP